MLRYDTLKQNLHLRSVRIEFRGGKIVHVLIGEGQWTGYRHDDPGVVVIGHVILQNVFRILTSEQIVIQIPQKNHPVIAVWKRFPNGRKRPVVLLCDVVVLRTKDGLFLYIGILSVSIFPIKKVYERLHPVGCTADRSPCILWHIAAPVGKEGHFECSLTVWSVGVEGVVSGGRRRCHLLRLAATRREEQREKGKYQKS